MNIVGTIAAILNALILVFVLVLLPTVVAALQAASAKRALLSGYHDETGGAAINAEVAKNRALSVRAALVAAGVPAERVLMRRPAVTLGGGDAAEARRVEVRVQ